MGNTLDQIKQPIAQDLKEFEKKFRESMKSHVSLLDRITQYIVQRKGKQVRPMFVFLSANLTGKTSEATHVAASMVELLHTATLVHDDIVDESYQRRGFFSINALWKNKIAVLVGDYLLSRGLLISVNNNQFKMLEIMSNTVQEMSEGELLQIEKARRLDIEESIYYEIIRKKTASLIASACASGMCSVTNDEAEVERARLLGEKIGMAFQVKDDLFDYGDKEIGKPRGIDIKERKMTLPLIYTLNNADKADRKWMINTVKNHNTKTDRVNKLIEFVKAKGGIQYTEEVMHKFKDEALEKLHEYPATPARDSLEKLLLFTIERKY